MTQPNKHKYRLKDLVRIHVRSYKWAVRGLFSIFLQQLNFKIQLFVSVLVIAAALFFQITRIEWIIIIFVIFMVLISEAINSAVEAVSDAVSKDQHQDIRYAKDVGAGATLLAAIASVIIGLIIFLPYIQKFIEGKF